MSNDERSGRSKERRIHERYRSKLSHLISVTRKSVEVLSPELYRGFCDYCMKPRKPGRPKLYGRSVTYLNADKLAGRRHLAELALKFFNDNKSTAFKLVKVCKINSLPRGTYALTFSAQEDEVKECLVFRGVVYESSGRNEALFCEIKYDDVEITLLPGDKDYVGPERALRKEMAASGDQSLVAIPKPV